VSRDIPRLDGHESDIEALLVLTHPTDGIRECFNARRLRSSKQHILFFKECMGTIFDSNVHIHTIIKPLTRPRR
jgi:hypothetical protein